MKAIEITNLNKHFGQKQVLSNLSMNVLEGSIYGFIGENGSGKSTTLKSICGLLNFSSGSIKLYGKDYKDEKIRKSVGCLIEAPGCFPNSSVWDNMMFQALNLGIKNPNEEIAKALKTVRMEGAASNKFKNCSLGMKQRIGIAFALLGNPKLLILDEPINGLDADGMRIMREVLVDITKNYNATVVISSHILSELEKVATHYGIIRNGTMLKELTKEELENECPNYILVKSNELDKAYLLLKNKYQNVKIEEDYIKIFDNEEKENIVSYLYEGGIIVSEIKSEKINLEEYYNNLMGV